LLTAAERKVLAKAESLAAVHRFADIAQVEVGMVTGANEYFLVPDSTVDEFALHQIATPMVGRSQHLPGIRYTNKRHSSNRKIGLPVNFVDFANTTGGKMSEGMRRYIRYGEALGLHKRYKTRIRSPWYIVPSKWVPQLFLLKRSHYVPKLVLNDANALNTDTAYRVSTKVSATDFAFSFYNSLTAISAELEGRSYGGGVLELVPSEIRRLLVPLVKVSKKDLEELDSKLANQEPNSKILQDQDRIVLAAIGLTNAEIRTIQKARLKLQSRRLRQSTELTIDE
jgi:adenine-specific DNA methylase